MEGIAAGNLFYDKNYDNIFLLSGGIQKFAVSFKDKIDGTLPKVNFYLIFFRKQKNKFFRKKMKKKLEKLS